MRRSRPKGDAINGDDGQRGWAASAGEATRLPDEPARSAAPAHGERTVDNADGGPTFSRADGGRSEREPSNSEPAISRARLVKLLAVSLCASTALGIVAFTAFLVAVGMAINQAFDEPVVEDYYRVMNRTVYIAVLLCLPLLIGAHYSGLAAMRALPTRSMRVGFALLSFLVLAAGVLPAAVIADAIENTLPPQTPAW